MNPVTPITAHPEGPILMDTTTATFEAQQLLTPAEVARLFRVDPKTVTRWAQAGKLSSVRTLGGHRRFPREEVLRHLRAAAGVPGTPTGQDSTP